MTLDLPQRPRILVIALRRLGDVLLTTPLIRSLRLAWPQAEIDVLVFADTAGILDGNPDLDRVIAMPERPTLAQSLALARRHLAALCARRLHPNRRSADLLRLCSGPPADRPGRRDRAIGSNGGAYRSVPAGAEGDSLHRVDEVLRLADALGIARASDMVAPQLARAARPQCIPRRSLCGRACRPDVPLQTMDPRRLARDSPPRWLSAALPSSPPAAPGDRRYLDDVWAGREFVRLDGELAWPEIAALLSGARVYVGPDTSVTHLAAAAGCPTVALYGPTDPRRWGPWPRGGLDRALGRDRQRIQRRGNVWLVQNPLPCTPCQKEGCERHPGSYSQCLDELSAEQVLRRSIRRSPARKFRARVSGLEHDPEKWEPVFGKIMLHQKARAQF